MTIPRVARSVQAAGLAAAMALGAGTTTAEDRSIECSFVVMVEFAVEDETGAVIDTVRDLLDGLVAGQPGFQSARLHRGEDGNGVINYMRWNDRAAFDAFRQAHGGRVTEAIGAYVPQFRFYEIVHATVGG